VLGEGASQAFSEKSSICWQGQEPPKEWYTMRHSTWVDYNLEKLARDVHRFWHCISDQAIKLKCLTLARQFSYSTPTPFRTRK